jgi:hypothetical protein
MFRRRKPRVEVPRYPRRWPWAALWAFGLVGATATLLALGFLVAQPPPSERWGPLDELLTAARMTGPAIALTVAALTAIALCFRRLWLDWLGARPGRINVEKFSAASVLDETDLEQLTLRFRHRLAELHLNAPASVPGAAADGDFLDVLGASGVDSRNWLGSALALLRASKPRHAWQVRGVLVQRAQRPGYGLTVHVLRLPDTANPPDTIWGTSWDEVIKRGADRVTAAILPRTWRCRRQWAAWRRYRMPGKLLEAYEDAAELEVERRYDEALDALYKASEHDPMNMGLRLRIGQLQERLGLYIDALATYQGMLTVGTERKVPKRTRERRAARRERRRALVAARYRKIILLGGSELAEQWRKDSTRGVPDSKRDRRRRLLRKRLRAPLEADLNVVTATHPSVPLDGSSSSRHEGRGSRHRPRRGELDAGVALAEPPAPQQQFATPAEVEAVEKERLYELRELFALAALREVRALLKQLRFHARDKRVLLTPDTVRLTALCIEVRLDWIQHILTKRQSTSWPPHPALLRAQVGSLERVRWFYRWHEHYNAACLFSLPLMADEIRADSTPGGLGDTLAELAVERLARATAHADSAYIAGRSDWLLSEDPDLDGLRSHWRFKDFEAMNFPAPGATPARPEHVKRLESSWYVKDLLIAASECWEQAWHTRGRELDGNADIHQLLAWWDDECATWDLVREVALNNRHWPTRVKLLHRLQAQAEAYRFEPPRIAFPHYGKDGHLLTPEQLGSDPRTAADAIADATEQRLAAIGKAVRDKEAAQSAGAAIAHIDRWQSTLRRLDAQGREPRLFLLALLCDHHAALWQLLREAITAEPRDAIKARDRFRRQMARADSVWSSAATWWRAPRLVWAAAHRGARPLHGFAQEAGNGREATPVA